MAWTGGRAPPSQNRRLPCAGSHWPAEARGSLVRAPSASRPCRAPSSHELEPPANPGRFTGSAETDFVWIALHASSAACSRSWQRLTSLPPSVTATRLGRATRSFKELAIGPPPQPTMPAVRHAIVDRHRKGLRVGRDRRWPRRWAMLMSNMSGGSCATTRSTSSFANPGARAMTRTSRPKPAMLSASTPPRPRGPLCYAWTKSLRSRLWSERRAI
ncbi:hypothetical protein ABMB68_009069 [Bradyrhizobium sp. RT4a]